MLQAMRRVSLILGLTLFGLAAAVPSVQAIPCNGLDVDLSVLPGLPFSVTPVCDRSDFRDMTIVGNKVLEFTDPAFTVYFSGKTLQTTDGELNVTLLRDPLTQNPLFGDFEIREQLADPLQTSWEGNFANGDKVLFNRGTSTAGSDAAQLQFDQLVSGIGTQIGRNSVGTFIGQLQIFGDDDLGTPLVDESLIPLATLRAEGFACNANALSPPVPCPENSAIFLGLVLGAEAGRRGELNAFNPISPGTNEETFGFNTVEIGTVAPTVVPAPATLVLLGLGLGGATYFGRRRLRA